MSKKKNIENRILSEDQEKQLQDMVDKMLNIAADTVEEYEEGDLSQLAALSGSITQIHEDSPYLNELFKGDAWKRVMSSLPKTPKKNK